MEEMEADPNAPGWQEVEVMQAEPVDLVEQEERGIMDEEPVLNAGAPASRSSIACMYMKWCTFMAEFYTVYICTVHCNGCYIS